MPRRSKPPQSDTAPAPNFRARYDELEQRRAVLVERVQTLGEAARSHPAYRRAMVLLNESFRGATVAQRAAILKAADWLINLIDISTTLI